VKNIRHIFFDLDHTLWDFDRNSSETLLELYDVFHLSVYIPDVKDFIAVYCEINHRLWKEYALGEISKAELRHTRFRSAFGHFNVPHNDGLSEEFGAEYMRLCPLKPHLIPGAKEVLQSFRHRFKLHIITNGFMEIQEQKLQSSGITDYFDLVLCSEEVGFNKPHPEIFRRALKLVAGTPAESLMVGDTFEADITGAKGVGMKAILFNPEKTFVDQEVDQIHRLMELIERFP